MRQRVRTRGFLPSLSTKDARTLKRVTAGVGFRAVNQPYKPGWSIDRAIQEGFEKVLWVYRCVDAIATNAANRTINLQRDGRDGEVVDGSDVRLLHLLNKRPNDYETAKQFRYRLSAQLLLSKQGVFVELVRSNGGDIAELHLLPAGRTSPIPGVPNPKTGRITKFVQAYRVEYADGGYDDLKPENVLWIRKPHPTDPYMGTTPLEAAGLTADIDFYARLFNRNFMVNDGRPGGLVAVKGELSAEDAAELKSRFSGGPKTAGRTTVIEADEVSWVDTATTPRDAQYTQAQAATKLDLLLAFGVPESVLGNASGRTYDNAGAEEAIFWRVTMLPHVDMIAEAFDTLTPGGVEDELHFIHDVSDIAPLRRDERERHAKLLQELQAGAITLDEYREGTGRTPFDVPGTNVLWFPMGKMGIAENEEDQAAVLALMGGATGAPAGPGLPIGSEPDDEFSPDPEPDPLRGGLQADAAARELDLVASGAGNATGNGTLDPRGNGIARGVKDLRGLALEDGDFLLPDDVSPAELTRILELLAA